MDLKNIKINSKIKYYGIFMIGLICVLVIFLLVRKNADGSDHIVFNQMESAQTQKNKVVLPTGAISVIYDWDKVCEYYGKDISLSYLPESIQKNDRSKEYTIFEDENGNVLMDNITFEYSGINGESISIITSKGKLPISDLRLVKGEKSVISGVDVMLYKNDKMLQASFIDDNIGYQIQSVSITEDEFMKVIESMIKKD